MHNGVFDVVTTINNFDINLTSSFHADTMYQKHTLDEEYPHDLDSCVKMFQQEILLEGEFSVEKKKDILHDSIKANGGKITGGKYELYKADVDIIAEYGIADNYLTLRLFRLFEQMLEDTGQLEFFYDKEVMPLARHGTIPMRLHGVPIKREYYVSLKKEVENAIMDMEEEVYADLQDDVEPLVRKIIDKEVKVSRTGAFGKEGLRYLNIPIPKTKQGKETVSRKALEKLADDHGCPFLDWMLWDKNSDKPEPELKEDLIHNIKESIYFSKNPGARVFSLRSGDHLRWLFFEKYECEYDEQKVSKKTGKPAVDEEFLKSDFVEDIPIAEKILKIRKEEKILSTYVNPILKREVNGFIEK